MNYQFALQIIRSLQFIINPSVAGLHKPIWKMLRIRKIRMFFFRHFFGCAFKKKKVEEKKFVQETTFGRTQKTDQMSADLLNRRQKTPTSTEMWL